MTTGVALAAACSGSSLGDLGRSCRGDGTSASTTGAALSYFGTNQGYTGASLAPKTLALTFDDGPGSQTLALSAYLKNRGIRATFFVNGHCFGAGVAQLPQCQQNPSAAPADIFTQVIADGHLVQNHTQTHADLTDQRAFPPGAAGNAAVVKELSDTDAIVAPFVEGGRFLFRAPYGAYDSRDHAVLEASPMAKYVGPVKWDIGGAMTGPKTGADDAPGHYGADWDCWQNRDGYGVKTTAGCATRYLRELAAVGHGIVLMHDADYGNVANHVPTSGKGNSIDMLKLLLDGDASLGIVGLVAQGYRFVRLDDVPQIAAALPASAAAGLDATASDAARDAQGGSSGATASGGAGSTPTSQAPAVQGAGADPCASP